MNGKRAKAIRKSMQLDFSHTNASGNRVPYKPQQYEVQVGEKDDGRKDDGGNPVMTPIMQWKNPRLNAYCMVKRLHTRGLPA